MKLIPTDKIKNNVLCLVKKNRPSSNWVKDKSHLAIVHDRLLFLPPYKRNFFIQNSNFRNDLFSKLFCKISIITLPHSFGKPNYNLKALLAIILKSRLFLIKCTDLLPPNYLLFPLLVFRGCIIDISSSFCFQRMYNRQLSKK